MPRRNLIALSVALATAAIVSSPAKATDPFAGKQIKILIGSSAGGGYDLFARTIAAHWARHIPGSPAFVPQNMPGALSINVANNIFNIAAKDGTVVGAVNPQIASEAILNPDRARFDARKFVWIGSALRETQVMIGAANAPVTSFEQAFERELILGGSGGATNTFPTLTNAVLGTKFKIVSGYPGTREVNLAMERGEVQGIGAITWASVKATMGAKLKAKEVVLVGQYGAKKHPELPNVAHVPSFAKSPDDQAALRLLFATQEFGRPYIAAPGTPADVAKLLQTSFMATMNDREFLADAAKRGLDIEPMDGAEIQSLVENLYTTPAAVVERVRAIFK
ncbi:MAG: Bug family tripartite tricarboxylate transporter substrate binding protein [Beijerinckiaceae bacterium]